MAHVYGHSVPHTGVENNIDLKKHQKDGVATVWDPDLGLWYNTHTGYYYEPNRQLWYDPQTGLWNDPSDPSGRWFDPDAALDGERLDTLLYEDQFGQLEDEEGNLVNVNEKGGYSVFLGAEIHGSVRVVYRETVPEKIFASGVSEIFESELLSSPSDAAQQPKGAIGKSTARGGGVGVGSPVERRRIDFQEAKQEPVRMNNKRLLRRYEDTCENVKEQYRRGQLHKFAEEDRNVLRLPFGCERVTENRRMPAMKYIYNHNLDPTQDTVEQAKQNRPPCLNYYEGKCKMGHFCYWRHDANTENKVFFDVLDCPFQHGVYLIKAFQKRGYMCDICQQEIEMNSNVFQCRKGECKFDCCSRCGNGARHINKIGVKDLG